MTDPVREVQQSMHLSDLFHGFLINSNSHLGFSLEIAGEPVFYDCI